MPQALFRLEHVSKTYAMGEVDVHALQEVDLELYQGDLVVVLGASGYGKSTLLNIIGGMDQASQGEVWYRDLDLSRCRQHELTMYRRREVGFVFQFYNLMPALTVRENVELASEIAPEPLDVLSVL